MSITRRNHRKSTKVLIVPDDHDEPKSFSFTNRQIRIYKLIGFVLCLHLLAGVVFYYLYFRLNQKHEQLLVINRQLEENNERINELMNEFEGLENFQNQLGSALGLGAMGGKFNSTRLIDDNEPVMPLDASPHSRDISLDQNELKTLARKKLYFLKETETTIHDFERSVPTLLPVNGVFTRDFSHTTYQDEQQHRGVDIAAERGTIVKAAADGVVLFSGWTYDLGILIILYHGNGFYTYYGHNQVSLVKRGAFVKKGDSISLLGSTGISSAPHLHFEIWKDGEALDPKQYILAFSDLENSTND